MGLPEPDVVDAAPDTERAERADISELFQSEHARLVRLAHLLTGSVAAAEDVVQDAFMNLHRRRALVHHPEAYLRQAVINGSNGFHRRRLIELRHRADDVRLELPPEVDEMWALLRRLPAKRRAVVVLRYYEDLSVKEIAALMRVREGTVRSLLHRALTSLKENIDHV